MRKLMILMTLAGCGAPATTPEGCPIYMTEAMQAQTRACVAAYRAEKARQEGRPVTECFDTASGMVCTGS